jgi:hypothetical protein
MSENPYESPQVPEYFGLSLPPRLTWRHIIGLLFVGVAGGACLGAVTNAVNGALSPRYFIDVMGWRRETNIWVASILWGILEGAAFGLAYAFVFMALISFASHRRCRFSHALRYGLVTLALAFGFWILGGASGVAYADIFRDRCDHRFFGYHDEWPSLARYAWVRGSIWGIESGGFLAVLITNAHYLLFKRWRCSRGLRNGRTFWVSSQ